MSQSKLPVKNKKQSKEKNEETSVLPYDPSITYNPSAGYRMVAPGFLKWIMTAKLTPSAGAILYLIFEKTIAFHKPFAVLKTQDFLDLPEIKDRQQFYKALKALKSKGLISETTVGFGKNEYGLNPTAFGATGIHVGPYKQISDLNNMSSEVTTSQKNMSSEVTTRCSQNTLQDVVTSDYKSVPNPTPVAAIQPLKESLKENLKEISPTPLKKEEGETGSGVALEVDQIDDFMNWLKGREWGTDRDKSMWRNAITDVAKIYPTDMDWIIKTCKFMVIEKKDLYSRPIKAHPTCLLSAGHWPRMKEQAELRRQNVLEAKAVLQSDQDKVYRPEGPDAAALAQQAEIAKLIAGMGTVRSAEPSSSKEPDVIPDLYYEIKRHYELNGLDAPLPDHLRERCPTIPSQESYNAH